jgi:hypothetical protein
LHSATQRRPQVTFTTTWQIATETPSAQPLRSEEQSDRPLECHIRQ